MEKGLTFHILGIKATKNENEIRNAYMALLKQTNPEDNPEAFKRLREAYEAAMVYARQGDTAKADEKEPTELDLWLKEVEQVYLDMDLRRRTSAWQELFSDPVCDELDTSVEVKERLLRFLMDHIYLPHEVWKLIDKTFHIIEEINELKERFPLNFLKYIKYYTEHETFIRYDLFRIDDAKQQNGDKYLEYYFAAKEKLDQGKQERCPEQLEDLKAFGLYHPYEDIERMRFLIDSGQEEQAAALGETLLKQYEADSYISGWTAAAWYESGRKAAAYELWQEVLKEFPLYYQAKMGCVRYRMEQGDYYQVREWLQEILEINSQNQEAMDILTECNAHLIEEYTQKIKLGKPDDNLSNRDMRIELGWCLFQNEQIPEAIRSLEDFQPDESSLYDFSNLFGRLLYHDKQYERARPHLETWLRLIEETADDGTDKIRRRLSRRCRAMNILGSCLHELGDEEAAEACLRRAIQITENLGERLGTMNYLAHILFERKQYENAVDMCDEIIREDDGYYPAYLTRQEACYELNRGQEVVDDYHRAVNIFPGYYKPYLLAIEIFFYYHQYEDAVEIFKRAREQQVEFSDRMKLFEVKLQRNLAESETDREQASKTLRELIQDLTAETDIKDHSELEFEMGLLARDDGQLEAALTHLQQAISQNRGRMQYRLIRGNIYLDLNRYEEALEEYQAAGEVYSEEPSLHYNRGLCYEALGQTNMAVKSYEQVLKIRDTYRNACEKVMNYYKQQYETNCRTEDLDKAIAYISREIKEQPESYYLIKRGRLYLSAFRMEPAIADFEKAIADMPDNWAVNNNLGCCYKYMGQFKTAIKYFKKAAAGMDEEKSLLPYNNMAHCYESLGQYQEALHCYQENLKLFPDKISVWEDIGDLYVYQGDYHNAIKAYEKIKTQNNYALCIANIHERNGDIKKALWCYINGIHNAHLKKNGNIAESWSNLADFAVLHYPAMAAFAYKRAIKGCKDQEGKFWYEQKLSTHYYRSRKFAKAKHHAGKALKKFKKTGKEEADYVEYPSIAPARLRTMALLYMALGDYETCERYFEKMSEIPRCRICRRPGCYEKYYYRGIYREINHDLAGAAADYHKSRELNPNDYRANLLLNRLRKRMDKKNDNRY